MELLETGEVIVPKYDPEWQRRRIREYQRDQDRRKAVEREMQRDRDRQKHYRKMERVAQGKSANGCAVPQWLIIVFVAGVLAVIFL